MIEISLKSISDWESLGEKVANRSNGAVVSKDLLINIGGHGERGALVKYVLGAKDKIEATNIVKINYPLQLLDSIL